MLTEFAVVINVWQDVQATSAAIAMSVAITAVHVVANVALISWAVMSLRTGHPAWTLPRSDSG